MSLFDWRPKYSVNHPLIDEQHQGLFRAADQLHQAMMRGAGRQIIGDTLAALVEYTQKHFREEEGLMRQSKYPLYVGHKAEHDEFTRRVLALKQGFENGQMAVTIETMQFLRDWLETHIMGRDTLIARHINAAGSPAGQPATAASGRLTPA